MILQRLPAPFKLMAWVFMKLKLDKRMAMKVCKCSACVSNAKVQMDVDLMAFFQWRCEEIFTMGTKRNEKSCLAWVKLALEQKFKSNMVDLPRH